MRPVLFCIKGIPIYSYGTTLALAFIVGFFFTLKEGKRYKLSIDAVLDLTIVVSIGALIGARIGYLFLEIGTRNISLWTFFNTREGGLSFHGGLIGGFLGGILFCRLYKRSLWEIADLVTPCIPLGYSIVRIGCLLNGCCYGYPSKAPWAFACSSVDNLHRHPTQLYSFVLSFLLFLIIWKVRNSRPFDGYLFLLYIGLYSITRFFVEFFRESQLLFGWMKVAQFASVILSMISFGYIGLRLYKLKREQSEKGDVGF